MKPNMSTPHTCTCITVYALLIHQTQKSASSVKSAIIRDSEGCEVSFSKKLALWRKSMSKGLKVFITYAHKNSEAKDKLITYLAVLKQNGLIDVWHDNEILPGDKWRDTIFNNLADSDILLYLTCPYSLASEKLQ